MSNWIDWSGDTGKSANRFLRAFENMVNGGSDQATFPAMTVGKCISIDGSTIPAGENATWEGWTFYAQIVHVDGGGLATIQITDVKSTESAAFVIDSDFSIGTPPFKVGESYTLPIDIMHSTEG